VGLQPRVGEVLREVFHRRLEVGERTRARRNVVLWDRFYKTFYKLSRSAFLMKKAYHSMSDFLVHQKYNCHCLPKS
jgi:hypothetical protein